MEVKVSSRPQPSRRLTRGHAQEHDKGRPTACRPDGPSPDHRVTCYLQVDGDHLEVGDVAAMPPMPAGPAPPSTPSSRCCRAGRARAAGRAAAGAAAARRRPGPSSRCCRCRHPPRRCPSSRCCPPCDPGAAGHAGWLPAPAEDSVPVTSTWWPTCLDRSVDESAIRWYTRPPCWPAADRSSACPAVDWHAGARPPLPPSVTRSMYMPPAALLA